MDDTPPPVPLEMLLAHREWVRRVARALVPDESRADDLEQELWVKVLEKPPRGLRSVRAWLGTVLRNAAGNARRTERNRTRKEADAAAFEGESTGRDLVAEADLCRTVTTAVLELEEPYRTAILLRYFEDLPAAEIARRQGVPLETVRTRLRRAVERLRERMDRGADGDRRRWIALLLPLARSGEPTPAYAAPAGIAALIGGIAMAFKTKTALVAAAALLLLLGGAVVLQPWGSDGEVSNPAGAPLASSSLPKPASTARSGGTAASAAPVEDSDPASLQVSVTDLALVPVGGARVSLHRDPGNAPPDSEAFEMTAPAAERPPAIAEAVADGAGHVKLRLDEQGALALVVRAAGFATSKRFLSLSREQPATPVKVALERACSLDGAVLEADGRPAPGVEVRARTPRSNTGDPWRSTVAVTSASGEFHMEGLVPIPSHLSVRRGSLAWSEWSADLPRQARITIRLPAGSIAAAGRVVDDASGAPVAGAAVAAYVETWEPQPIEAVAEHPSARGVALTAEDGTFRIDGLPPGRVHFLGCRKEGFLAWPDYRIDSSPRREPTPPGGAAEQEIRLRRGVSIVGTVTNPEGRPVHGAIVNAYSFAGKGGDPLSAGSVRTEPDGTYRTPPILPGRVVILASALTPPRRGLYQEGRSFLYDKDPGPPISIDLPPDGGMRYDIRLIRGTGVVEGIVVDDGGRPVASAFVSVAFGRGFRGGAGIPATTGADGTYRITAVAPGEGLRVWATVPGAQLDGGGEFFDLAEGGTAVGQRIVVTLQPSVAGRVVRADGAPLRGAALYLYAESTSPPSSWSPMNRLEPIPVGPDGSFRLGVQGGGSFHLLAKADGCAFGCSPAFSAKTAAPAKPLELTLTLVPAAPLRGRVLDAEGAPVPGARVTARRTVADDQPREGYPAAWTGRDGAFSLDSLQPGPYRIEVRKEGSQPFLVDAEAGGPEVEVRMPLFAPIAGRVLDPDGDLSAVQVEVRVGETWAWWTAPAKADGTFESIPLDPAQRYRVRAWAPGAMQSVRRDVVAGTRGLELRLSRTSAIAGRILDETGAPASAPVMAVADGVPSSDVGAWIFGRSADDGTFRLECNGELRYRVTAGGSDSGLIPRVLDELVVPDAGALEIRLSRGAQLDGMLRDAEGRAVGGISIYAVLDGVYKYCHPARGTDADGRFSVRGVPAGEVRLRALMQDREKWADLGTFTAPATGLDLRLPK